MVQFPSEPLPTVALTRVLARRPGPAPALCSPGLDLGPVTAHTTRQARTWMARCDGAVVLSNVDDELIPSVKVPHLGPEVRGSPLALTLTLTLTLTLAPISARRRMRRSG